MLELGLLLRKSSPFSGRNARDGDQLGIRWDLAFEAGERELHLSIQERLLWDYRVEDAVK